MSPEVPWVYYFARLLNQKILMEITFKINKQTTKVEAEPEMPLLWVLRDLLDLKATKYGCGMALCGACSVLVDGELMRACSLPISAVANKEVSTLEGLSPEPELLHPVQQAWIDENVPQCGYCQSGFMMATVKLLEEYPNPSDADIKANINNICRCGTQPRIIKAIKRAAILTQESKKQNHVD